MFTTVQGATTARLPTIGLWVKLTAFARKHQPSQCLVVRGRDVYGSAILESIHTDRTTFGDLRRFEPGKRKRNHYRNEHGVYFHLWSHYAAEQCALAQWRSAKHYVIFGN